MTKKKAVLIFPDGVGVRNYLYSDVFKNVDTELIILHDFDDETQKLISDSIKSPSTQNLSKKSF